MSGENDSAVASVRLENETSATSSRHMQRELINERYSLLRQIGRGTTGLVYVARDHHLNRNVAVKVIHKELINNEEIHSRFETEVRITAMLQHPGIVSVFERCELADGCIGYIMSLAVGNSLEDYLEDLRSLDDHWSDFSLIDRLNLFVKILDVLSYAHSMGVVHRDLKPANIVLGQHGEVHVLDWGLARSLGREEDEISLNTYDEIFGDEERAVDVSDSTRHDNPNVSVEDRPTDREEATRVGGGGEQVKTDSSAATRVGESAGDAAKEATARIDNRNRTSTRFRTDETGRRSAKSSRIRTSSFKLPNGAGSSGKNERSTQLGAVLGSPAYMSPEQARGDASSADERADIYSLGVILVELLTLRTPSERQDAEPLVKFIERVRDGDRNTLSALWDDAPERLEAITEWSLALNSEERFPDCDTFRSQLGEMLDELSASFSELERQRLAKERLGAWLPHGQWNYDAKPGLEPFSEPVVAYEGEAIGQVMHPELGGLLLGGTGLQIYPVSMPVSDDLRITLEVAINRGREFAIFVRGVPPAPSYCLRIGAYNGRWITIARSSGPDDLFHPDLLSMRALQGSASTSFDHTKGRRRRVTIEVVGSKLQIALDNQEPIAVRDPCPLMGPLHRQMAVGTSDSQIVVHWLTIERRQSPLMVPTFHVANELLRQKLYPQAIDFYRRFLTEHQDSEHEADASFMLCLAFLKAGHKVQAERELQTFLADYLEHSMAQDAIFELARLAIEPSGIDRGVRTVLSYQEADDLVRSRFCLWVMHILSDRVAKDGLSENVIKDLKLLRHLISGFPDEALILNTIALGINESLQDFANRVVDSEHEQELQELSLAMANCRKLGYEFSVSGLHTSTDYNLVADRLKAVEQDDTIRIDSLKAELIGYSTVRDHLRLAHLGCLDELLEILKNSEPSPVERILRAAMLLRTSDEASAQDDLHVCFRLMDIIEVERTSQEVTATARLAFYGLGYLPWDVIWEPIQSIRRGQELQALAGWLAEGLGHREQAADAYRHLLSQGQGYVQVAREGLIRVGADPAG